LPLRVERIGRSELFINCEALLKGYKRLLAATRVQQHVPKLAVGRRQAPLEGRIAWIESRKLLAQRQALSISFQRLLALALVLEDVTDPVIGDHQIVLPLRVVRIGCRDLLAYCKACAKGLQCFRQLPFQDQHVADVHVGHRHLALVFTVRRVGISLAGADEDELEDELPQNSSGATAQEAQKSSILSVFSAGGAEGGRTPDLLIAK
jgi:hypothetical protein